MNALSIRMPPHAWTHRPGDLQPVRFSHDAYAVAIAVFHPDSARATDRVRPTVTSTTAEATISRRIYKSPQYLAVFGHGENPREMYAISATHICCNGVQ